MMGNGKSKQPIFFFFFHFSRYAKYELSFVKDGATPVRHDDILPRGVLALAAVREDEVALRLAALIAVVVEAANLVRTPHRGAAARVIKTELAAFRGALAIRSIIRVTISVRRKSRRVSQDLARIS